MPKYFILFLSIWRLVLLGGDDGGQLNKEDQMKLIWFGESSCNRSGHSWPPAQAACLLKWHWIREKTAFVQAWADAAVERIDSGTETLSRPVPYHFSWWTPPDRVQKTLWGGAAWYQLASRSADSKRAEILLTRGFHIFPGEHSSTSHITHTYPHTHIHSLSEANMRLLIYSSIYFWHRRRAWFCLQSLTLKVYYC